MGFEKGQLLLEVGHGSDCDEKLRNEISTITGNKFIEGKTKEVVDAVLLWWRDDDGDLVDGLVDGLTYLTDDGPIWVLTPKAGRPGHLDASEIQDAANNAGLSQTSTISVAPDWTATRIVPRKSKR